MDAYDRFVRVLQPFKSGTPGLFFCPGHEDPETSRKPSLSVNRGRKGVLLTCRGGPRCSAQTVVEAMGLTLADLFYVKTTGQRRRKYRRSGPPKPKRPAEKIPAGDPMPADYLNQWPFRVGRDCEYRHPWVDAEGRILAWELKVKNPKPGLGRLFYRPSPLGPIGGITKGAYIQNGREGGEFACWHRFTEEKLRKEARRRRCRPEDVPVRRLQGVRLPLWGLPQVLESVAAGRTIALVGGPKDAETARRILDRKHYVATAWHGGEGSFRKDLAESLRGADVVISLDNDAAGRAGTTRASRMLRNVAASIRIAVPFGTREGSDVSDFVRDLEEDGSSDEEIAEELTMRLDSARPTEVQA